MLKGLFEVEGKVVSVGWVKVRSMLLVLLVLLVKLLVPPPPEGLALPGWVELLVGLGRRVCARTDESAAAVEGVLGEATGVFGILVVRGLSPMVVVT